MALDLDALKRVADAGLPLDNVPVSRRWLAQVWHELATLRGDQPVKLDYDHYAADRFTIPVPCGGSGAVKA
ncbi:hypothetical protein [Sphingomonas parapaucimobilis]|uniref:Uncharacterized protein n=1 Tax=Sphingomonas parapaucimobilis NBRC 15100 TaxID=1219049 RepID=A0A0A1W533_9SPHN|nr:hypothetical protein [Sphingomonas parapaucimobilis]GAM00550.1 hypothetical protein SP5_034_01250 [Sphingomonas parapaucimobilis NBRC 15100]